MQDVLNRWGNHQVPDEMLKSIFVGGLKPAKLKMFVKERWPVDLTNAYQTTKTWEEARVDEDFLPYAEITSFPTNRPQPRNTPTAIQTTLRPTVESYPHQTIVVAKDGRDNKNTIKVEDQMMEKLNELTNQFSEMKVNMVGNLNKRSKPTNTRTNVWCSNCQGHGHMNNECPSPQQTPTRCSYCNGRHETTHCWNLHGKPINQVSTNNRPWMNNPNKRPFTRPNVGPPYQPNDGRPGWNDTYNGPLVWNGPPTSPQIHRYGPYQPGTMIVCWNCDEIDHYRSNCPHPKREVGYIPLCGRCRQQGHTANECTAPKPMSSSSERDWNKAKQVEFQEEKNVAKNVNHIAKDTSYFVTHFGKKMQNIMENGRLIQK
jgi:hypothetical protein